MTDSNLHRKAASCRADLEFLLSIAPVEWWRTNKWLRDSIEAMKRPTEEKITAAWKLAAIIHDEIRKHDKPTNHDL